MEAHEVRNLEIEIEQAKQLIELRDALVRLEKNRDFKKVVSEGFLKDFVLQTIAVRARYDFRSSEILMKSSQAKIDAVAELQEYFRNIYANGVQMERALKEAEELRTQVELEE